MAVSRDVHVDRHQIVALRNSMSGFADKRGMIGREEFDMALQLANLSTVEIFDLLFTMWDNAGVNRVPFKGFCVGISPLACPYDSLQAILMFALFVSDDRDLGYIRSSELKSLLSGINSTASFFGDPNLSREEIGTVVESMFDGGMYKISHQDCLRRLVVNPYVKRFASGKARVGVQFKEELVEEITIEARKSNNNLGIIQVLAPTRRVENRFQPKSPKLWRPNALKRFSQRSQRTTTSSLVDALPSFEDDECTENAKPMARDPPPTVTGSALRPRTTRQDP
ncbi:MAG: hypothetical protein SGILL_001631 [Bacillariaceae sp.]